MNLLYLPLLLGATESEWRPLPRRAAALWEGPARFGRNRESRSREVRSMHPGYGTAGVGILPKQRPSKGEAEKEKMYRVSFIRMTCTLKEARSEEEGEVHFRLRVALG